MNKQKLKGPLFNAQDPEKKKVFLHFKTGERMQAHCSQC